MVKLICTDIDGTFLNKQREVDIYTKEVFQRFCGRFEVVLASSRMPKALWHIQKELGIIKMPLICYNGALVLSGGEMFSQEKIVSSVIIDEDKIAEIIEVTGQYDVHISMFYNNTWIASKSDLWAEREANNTRVKPDLILDRKLNVEKDKGIVGAAHKIMLMGNPSEIEAIEKVLSPKMFVSICRSKDTYLEITPIGTNKSKGLSSLLEQIHRYREITMENIMAFGDNHNDYELLNDVKYGIAVGNGVQRIKEIAYAVARSNHENGVAHYLNEFFED